MPLQCLFGGFLRRLAETLGAWFCYEGLGEVHGDEMCGERGVGMRKEAFIITSVGAGLLVAKHWLGWGLGDGGKSW